jgi:hypothetical protein
MLFRSDAAEKLIQVVNDSHDILLIHRLFQLAC